MGRILEACCVSPEEARRAAVNGAGRIELCECLEVGGVTPSDSAIAESVASGLPVFVLVRPRGGSFVFNAEEERQMVLSIGRCRNLGAAGVVIGALNADGTVDVEMMRRLVAEARGNGTERPLGLTFHRAFDEAADPFTALETIIGLDFDRILTSGQKPSAFEGRALIAQLVEKAAGRIIIMPGAGITPDNLEIIANDTKAVEFHGTRICSRNQY